MSIVGTIIIDWAFIDQQTKFIDALINWLN